jgi:DNA-binding response OmpR family regulator
VQNPEHPAPTGQTILVVDDEPTLRETVSYTLRREGFLVETAAEGTRALAIARERKPDLVVLDVMLPGMDGLQVCRALRRESTVPIIMLSARGEELDRVLGLEIGADDYLTKPFAMRELVARIRAQLRRVSLDSTPALAANRVATIDLGDLRIDQDGRRVSISGRDVQLKPMEFDLLVHLAVHRDKVATRAQLLRDVWGYEMPVDTRTVDVHVRGLRQKLAAFSGTIPEIETSRGSGYRLVMPAPASTTTA